MIAQSRWRSVSFSEFCVGDFGGRLRSRLVVEVPQDGERVILVDNLLATGGTAEAASKLLK